MRYHLCAQSALDIQATPHQSDHSAVIVFKDNLHQSPPLQLGWNKAQWLAMMLT